MSEDRGELVALAKFVYDTVGCDLFEYNIEPYSQLASEVFGEPLAMPLDVDTTPIAEALVDNYLAQVIA